MNIVVKVLLIVIGFIALFMAVVSLVMTRGMKRISKTKIEPIDFNKVKDGTYEGEHENGRWSNKVAVTVLDHKVTEVKIVEDVKFAAKDKEEAMLANIIKEQRNDVDVIAGGTITAKALLISVQEALKKGM